MKKEIIFPCGDNLTAKVDYGYAYGRHIKHIPIDGKGKPKIIGPCGVCTKCDKITHTARYMDTETGEERRYEDTFCIGYSQEYLDNKDKLTADYVDMDSGIIGPYTIEVIIQSEVYRRVEYIKGKSEGCSMLDLMDFGIDELLETAKEKDGPCYHLIMFNIYTGRLRDIEFENEEQVKNSIISVRLLKENEETV